MGPHSHAGKLCTDPACGFNRIPDRGVPTLVPIDKLREGAEPLTIKGYNDELPLIDTDTAFNYTEALGNYLADELAPLPDDALTMIEDLRRYFEHRAEED